MKLAVTSVGLLVSVGCIHARAQTQRAYPPLTPKHLAALSAGRRGISEFARGTKPENRRFCVEDTARALVAVLKLHALGPSDTTARLARHYLDAIAGLQQDDGGLLFGYGQDGQPIPVRAHGDQVGRALWGLGQASLQGVDPAMRLRAQGLFLGVLPHLDRRAPGPLPQSYALQGLHLFLRAQPQAVTAQRALTDCADHLLSRLRGGRDASWPWPNDVITYDSARLPLALLLAFESTGDTRYRDAGLRILTFLATINFPHDGGRLQLIGNHGWYPRGKVPARFDQQPIDASSVVEASLAAWRVTHDASWKDRARTAFSWFTGNNVHNRPLYDVASGGCRDGLGRDSLNGNQGAESTLSYWIARCEIETLEAPEPRIPLRPRGLRGYNRVVAPRVRSVVAHPCSGGRP